MRRLSDIVCDQNPLIMPRTATVKSACQKMSERRAGSVLVTDAEGGLVGIFTGRDAVTRVLAAGKSASKTKLSDVIIRRSGEVEKRRKKLSKAEYGTSHIISKAEAKSVFEKGCHLLVVGTGQLGDVDLSPEATEYFRRKDCRVVLQPTPEAIKSFNELREEKIGLMHVTC